MTIERTIVFPDRAAALLAGLALAGLVAGSAPAADAMTTGRGVHTDQRIDLPLDPGAAEAVKPIVAVAPVRVASGDDNADALKGLAQGTAAVEIVARADRPDLIWDRGARTLAERGQIVAYEIDADDITGAADRVALVRTLRDLSQKSPQPVKLQPDDRSYKAGQRFDIQLGDTLGRFAVVFAVSGDGTVEMLYPRGGDPTQVRDAGLTISLEAGPPFGIDQVVAMTSAEANPEFLQTLKRLDRRKAAGEVLRQIGGLPEAGRRVGLIALATGP